MEKQKRWQLFLIVGVIFLTVYNILPTVFYYTKPLKSPITEKRANEVAQTIVQRVNNLEDQSLEWLKSFCDLLQVKPSSILLDKQNPEFISVSFTTTQDAEVFRSYLPRAGALIPFVPAQLSTYDSFKNEGKNVVVKRRIPIHFDPQQLQSFFQYSAKIDANGQITPLYQALVNDRVLELGLALGGVGENAQYVQALNASHDDALSQELALQLSQNLQSFVKVFGDSSDFAKRFFSSFSQVEQGSKSELIQNFATKLESVRDSIATEKKDLQAEGSQDPATLQKIHLLGIKERTIESSIALVRKNQSAFASAKQPWNYSSLGSSLQKNFGANGSAAGVQTFSLEGKNPFFDKISIDWQNEKILLTLHPDLVALQKKLASTQALKEQAEQLIYNEIAFVNRQSGENIKPSEEAFQVALSQLADSKSFLAFRLGAIAKAQSSEIKESISNTWNPAHPDLKADSFPIWDYETYMSLPQEQKKLGLLVYSPVMHPKNPESGFRMNSIYVVAKGLERIIKKYEQNPNSEQSRQFMEDFYKLRQLLQKSGFVGYSGSAFPLSKEFADDYIFEASDYFQSIIMASRENFEVHGTKRYAVLEFSNVEQRILTENKIDTREHEDLLKWRDDYKAAQLKLKGSSKYDIPKPTKDPLFNNLKLSTIKYFRGDDRKILHWGLDLSGGKTVQIELRDSNNRIVTNEADIKQGINELYSRVNKMGVSEVSIRQEGHHITLDFPGSQGLSAAELVKASSMFFNVVNEKFTPSNPVLAESVNRFLQEVWNEAVVTNKKSVDDINQIAWKHLYGDAIDSEIAQPRSEAARVLYDSGLRFANPQEQMISNVFSETYSKLAVFRGDDYTQWQGQTHPLLVVFRNFALEGSNLENVHASYDPSKGNFLSFGVRGSYSNKEGMKISPRDDLSAWTTPFSKEKISGTVSENFSKGKGWRMAVILNGTIVSAPTLDSPLRDSAMISGSFSQREINQLEADLKAGSLSFTPKILSEKNVSPELGSKERNLGVLATVIALTLVVGVMVGYYRFGGVVASVAVVFNLLIMWATLQNIQATLTLPMLAGLILTVGMAVDANVLVFERIREEFAISGRIASAIQVGYKKAFSAILDSNVTTVIAGLVLLHFDSGPIKGFALTLIIGIVSSMFTALFMTKFFFARWVENPSNKKLSMMNLFKARNFNFLKYTKPALIISTVVIAIGLGFFVSQRHTIMGMDFTGGYALNLELKPDASDNYRSTVEKALIKQGLKAQDFQIRELSPSNNIRLFLSRSLEQPGKPFHNMSVEQASTTAVYEGLNPRIEWIITALEKDHVELTSSSIASIDNSWSEVSGQMSETMRNNAIVGLLIALLGILFYITIRFEFKYAISATLCLAHDIVFTLGTLAILHAMKVPLQIDLNIIAALMTIVGYSLNDTIIVFDRIREDIRLMKTSSFKEIINHSLNVTLSRTIMTSGTTLLVLIPLILLGGNTILGFSLVMAIGVIFGTLSSLFIAAPLMLYFHKKEMAKEQKVAVTVR